MQQESATKRGKAGVVLMAVGVVALAAAGVFGGNLAWRAFEQREAAAAAQVAAAAAKADSATPQSRQRRAVQRDMRDPESAIFRSERAATHDSTIWCGEINGRNSMGAMVGFVTYIVEMKGPPEFEKLDEVLLEPSDPDSIEGVRFKQRYMALCR